MGGVVRDVDVLVVREPAAVFEAFPDEGGHALEYAEVDELGVVGVGHGCVPEAADGEDLAVVVLGREVAEELEDA